MRYAGGSAGARGIATRLTDDDYFRRPDGVAPTPATFLGNHDVGRAALLIRQQTGSTGRELASRLRLGHALLYLLRGAPVVYYGDEVGMIGRGGDKAARQDMFPTRVGEWQTEERVGGPSIGTGSSFDVDLERHEVASSLRALAGLRERFPALATGSTAVRYAREGVLVVSRFDHQERREYVALFNASEERQTVAFATATPSSAWTQWLGSDVGRVESNPSGGLSIRIEGLDAVLLRSESQLPARGAPRATVRVGTDRFTSLRLLTATLPAPDPASVTFAVRRATGKAWTRLATDDGHPYRAYLDASRYRRGERLHAVALVRGSDESVSASAVSTFVVRP